MKDSTMQWAQTSKARSNEKYRTLSFSDPKYIDQYQMILLHPIWKSIN